MVKYSIPKAFILRMWGAALFEPFQPIYGALSHLMDIINYATFNFNRLRSFGLGDVRKTHVSFYIEVVLALFRAASLTELA